MLTELADMQLQIDALIFGLEVMRASQADKRKSVDEQIAAIEDQYIEDMAAGDEEIKKMDVKLINLCYTKSIVDAVTVHYESKAEEKLARDSEATAELYQADDTGGIKAEDWATFCAKTCVIAPEGVIDLPDDAEADEESAEESGGETEMQSTGT